MKVEEMKDIRGDYQNNGYMELIDLWKVDDRDEFCFQKTIHIRSQPQRTMIKKLNFTHHMFNFN